MPSQEKETLNNGQLQPTREPGLVSVIIPTYNHAVYIRDAITSVLCQKYPHYEIIVVDDGSKDNTREVIAGFGSQVTYLWQENQGLSAARNTGIRAAKGEYIGVLDADDMYDADFLTRMVAKLKDNPLAGGCYCGFQFIDAHKQALPQTGVRVVAPQEFHTALMDGNFLVPECILVWAGCYQQVGLFDVSLRACEDWDMWLRISTRYNIIGTSEILIHHRILPGSMSSDPQRMLNNRLVVLQKLFGETTEQGSIQQRAYGRAYLATALEYLQQTNLPKAYACLRTALLHSPDLLAEFDVYYELACGTQPKGTRGDFTTLDLQQNEHLLFLFLKRLFQDKELAPALKPYRRQAYANAFLALGLLGYGACQVAKAREYLLHAAGQRPLYLFQKPLALTLLKTMLGRRVISELKYRFHKA